MAKTARFKRGSSLDFLEILISSKRFGRQAQPMSKLFRGFLESQTPGAGVVPRPNMVTENCHLPKLVQTGIVGALRIDLGLLFIRILFFEIG